MTVECNTRIPPTESYRHYHSLNRENEEIPGEGNSGNSARRGLSNRTNGRCRPRRGRRPRRAAGSNNKQDAILSLFPSPFPIAIGRIGGNHTRIVGRPWTKEIRLLMTRKIRRRRQDNIDEEEWRCLESLPFSGKSDRVLLNPPNCWCWLHSFPRLYSDFGDGGFLPSSPGRQHSEPYTSE